MKLFLILLPFFLFLGSCSRVHLLGMQKHEFSVQPKHIIWFQLAGLNEEHVAMLRFATLPNERKSSLESMDCLGKMWNYNFYKIRPQSNLGFLAQMVGKDNIKNSCADYSYSPAWNILEKLNYRTYILENGANGPKSLLNSLNCPASGGGSFLDQVTLWSMAKTATESDLLFHYQDKTIEGIDKPVIAFDRACQNGICFSSLTENVRSLYRRIVLDKKSYLFIIRDFNLESKLKEGKIAETREVLSEYEKLLSYFKDEATGNPLMEIVVTSSAALPIEYPDQGVPWIEFENQGKNILYKKTALTSPAFAFGAGSENFCGFFNESEVYSRLLWFKTDRDKKGGAGFWF